MAAMKIFWITLVVLLAAALIGWVRTGARGFSVVEALPLIGRHEPSLLWDGTAVAMLLITLWGIRRLRRRR